MTKKTTNKSGLELGQNFGENPFSNHWVKFLPIFEAEQQVLWIIEGHNIISAHQSFSQTLHNQHVKTDNLNTIYCLCHVK